MILKFFEKQKVETHSRVKKNDRHHNRTNKVHLFMSMHRYGARGPVALSAPSPRSILTRLDASIT
jgi:hypothetical protein